ncbi:MAG: lipoate--protein ligase family protein [Verrucomicrobia bacterium]|nr:lipoate--protein ligase family protein [Verrucomicrobiota bacterium]
MKHLDLTLPTPAENLACDEALFDWCEESGGEVLRFWEPRDHFVVVGYANRVAREVNAEACAARGVPIFRRVSGGGTVLQGPGCLNYSVVLKITEASPLAGISGTNRLVLGKIQRALAPLLKTPPAIRGASDLCLGALKFSGNAQRRKRTHLLFHGTLLLDFDLPLISALLPLPSKQPDYRGNRGHGEFLTNLPLAASAVKAELCRAWSADAPLEAVPLERIQKLAAEKYSRPEWNLKF